QRVLPPQPRMFRALVLVTDAFGGSGGIAKFNRDLLSALSAMPECAEVVVTARLAASFDGLMPQRVTFKLGAARGKIRFVLSACREAFAGPLDLLICGHINLAPLSVALAATKRCPSLLVIHGTD